MANKYDAYDTEIKIDGRVVAGKTGLSIMQSIAMIDVTDNLTKKTTENLATRYSWTADTSAWVVDDADELTHTNYRALQEAFHRKQLVDIELYHPFIESINMVGKALITELTIDYQQDNAVSVNMALSGSGKLVKKEKIRITPDLKLVSVSMDEVVKDELGHYVNVKITNNIAGQSAIISTIIAGKENTVASGLAPGNTFIRRIRANDTYYFQIKTRDEKTKENFWVIVDGIPEAPKAMMQTFNLSFDGTLDSDTSIIENTMATTGKSDATIQMLDTNETQTTTESETMLNEEI